MTNISQFERSPLDEERFGVRAARAANVTADQIDDLLEFCEREQVEFLIVRVDTHQLDTIHRMESEGFHLMDTLVYYMRDFEKYPVEPLQHDALIREARAEDLPDMERIARVSFEGYFGHYHADPRLDNDLCDETYVDWVMRSLDDNNIAHYVTVAEVNEKVAGFAFTRMNAHTGDGDFQLACIAPEARGLGLFQALTLSVAYWSQEQGAKLYWCPTQITNLATQGAVSKLHFSLKRSVYTLHKWFDR